MKANRLISIILLLQKHKKMTAEKLSAELGVSIRTIYRDLTALSINGFPVYAEHGPGGGVCLIEEYQGGVKTLTSDEIDALQLMKIPDPLAALETGKTLQRAMLKLVSSLPEQREHSPNLFIDWNWWRHSGSMPEGRLEMFYQAVCERKTLHVEFPLWNRMAFSQEIDPYGVVAKAGEWYLVYAVSGRCRMRRISEIKLIKVEERSFIKPVDFDLEAAWKTLCAEEETGYFSYAVQLQISPEILGVINDVHWGIPYQVLSIEQNPDARGWSACTLAFASLIAARSHLLGWGSAVKVLSPDALRLSLMDFARQITRAYSTD